VLGNTIEEIAKNKAGIYKSGVPALSVPQDSESAAAVLKQTADANGAEFSVIPIIPDTPLGIRGKHQRINASLAVGLAKSFLATRGKDLTGDLPESFVKPLAETKWPGRCQKVERGQTTWLLDGAHTTESLRSCGEWAWSEAQPDVLIFNCSGGRAGESLLGSLLEAGARSSGSSQETLGAAFDSVVFCTNVTYTSGGFKGGKCCVLRVVSLLKADLTSNAIDPNDLAQLATQNALREAWIKLNPSFDPSRVHAVPSIEHAIDIVKTLGKRQVLVAGSLHLVGGVMEVAGLQGALGME